jgi:conjugal transfer pilus assembly protein TraW
MVAPILACLGTATPGIARDYGQQGAVWPIVEPDLLAQIHARLTHLEKTGETARLNEELRRRTIARVNRPEPVVGIGSAAATRSWRFDPTITVERDIADDKGRVIIAAGTRVNPLDTVPLRTPLVFLDGDDPAQLAWAVRRFGQIRAKLILVRGAPLELMKTLKHRFYFDQGGSLVKHFGIRAVPATVEQQGRVLIITEQAIERKERAPS